MAEPLEILDIADVERPSQISRNTFNENNIYDDNDLKPEEGDRIDVQTRNSNVQINRYNNTKQYTGPRR